MHEINRKLKSDFTLEKKNIKSHSKPVTRINKKDEPNIGMNYSKNLST